MTNDDFIKDITTPGNDLCFPFSYDTLDCDYLDYVEEMIRVYKHKIKKLDAGSVAALNASMDSFPVDKRPVRKLDLFADLQSVCDMLDSVLNWIYRNYYEEAYKVLDEFFSADDYHFLKMLPYLYVHDGGVLYRARTDDLDANEKDGRMFHVPFHKRSLVSPKRYSIPGYPALYLAGSLFTVWCELDKPQKGFAFAGYKPKEDLRFLDLSFPKKNSELDQQYSFLVFYPLIMACSVSVKYPERPFKPEYCLPQLMFSMVRNHGEFCDGISYLSTKVPSPEWKFNLSKHNFVLNVVNTVCRRGYDKNLADKMKVSDVKIMTAEKIKTNIEYHFDMEPESFALGAPRVSQFHDMDIYMEN